MNNEDKIYTIRKLAVMFTCMLIFVTLGLVVINFQAKTIIVNYYGEIKSIKTMSNTVEGMLMQNKIYIDDKAIVYPNKDTRLINNMEIKIYSEEIVAKLNLVEYVEKAMLNTTTEKVVEEVSIIPFEKEAKSNSKTSRGESKILQKGEEGKKIITYVLTYNGDKEVAKTVVKETVEKAALKEVVELGTKTNVVSRSATPRTAKQSIVVDGSFKEYNIKLPIDQQKHAYNMCQTYGIQYELFLALMYCESGFRAEAKSTTGYGICQINPSNLAFLKGKIGTTDLMDPYQNIKAGAYFFSRYVQKWGTSDEGELNALNSYNWGESRYRAYLAKGNNSDSWYYGKKVVAARNRLVANGGL